LLSIAFIVMYCTSPLRENDIFIWYIYYLLHEQLMHLPL